MVNILSSAIYQLKKRAKGKLDISGHHSSLVISDNTKRKNVLLTVLFVILLAVAGAIRWWAAPISSGPDVPQFLAFARVFQLHGLNFYQYADATLNVFPFKHWEYVYPPIWLLILRLCLFASPQSQASADAVDVTWRMAEKTPIILSDLIIGCLIYWAIPGSKTRKLVFATIWLFHPTVWYNSAVFGQFDALAAVFLIASLVVLLKFRSNSGLILLLAGIALAIKQHAFIAISGILTAGYRYFKDNIVRNFLFLLLPFAIVSIPFILDGNLIPYLKSVFLPAQPVGYQDPLVYAFSGTGSLLTYLHDTYGWETINLLKFTTIATILVLAGVLVACYFRRVNPLQAALASFLVFAVFFYRINYQYLVIYIAMAILVAATTRFKGERMMALLLALLPAVWLWLFDVTFWFTYLQPANPWVIRYFEVIGMAELSAPFLYVGLAVTLMCLSIGYIALVLTRWNAIKENSNQLLGETASDDKTSLLTTS
jgi:hypothetical protein